MTDSTNNKTIEAIKHDRTTVTLAISVVIIIIMGLLRPDKPSGMPPIRYWAEKLSWSHCADAVIAGDSRVFMGLSPAEMQKYLPYKHILNFGFSGNGYTERYLEAVEAVLKTSRKPNMILLGITPHSLTLPATYENSFVDLKKKKPQDVEFERFAGSFLQFFEPMSFRDAVFGLFPSMKRSHHFMTYYPDGWVAGREEPEKIKSELRRYRAHFTRGTVSDRVIDLLLKYVSLWSHKGIHVYAYRPPTCPEMVELEQNMSGFRQDDFIKAFERAGGSWIDVDSCGYHSYDGSHLHYDSALLLSKDLAVKIADAERRLCNKNSKP